MPVKEQNATKFEASGDKSSCTHTYTHPGSGSMFPWQQFRQINSSKLRATHHTLPHAPTTHPSLSDLQANTAQGRVHTCTCPCECSTVNNRFKGSVHPNLTKNKMLLVCLIKTNSLDSICPGLKVKGSMFVLKDWKKLKGQHLFTEILSLLQSYQQTAAPRKQVFSLL